MKDKIERSKLLHTDPFKYVECSICGYRAKQIHLHVKEHGISTEEYRARYGKTKAEIYCQEMRGERNPGKGHGGKLSPFSEKFIGNSNHKTIQQKAEESRKNNSSHTTTQQYWIKLGYSVEDAKKMLMERQRTFSKNKCIEKHGKESGELVWQQRQEKWQNALHSLPEERKREMNKKKLYRGGRSSKLESSVVDFLLENGISAERQFPIPRGKSNFYYFDIRVGNKLIEVNGDIWHANPIKYAENEIPSFPKNSLSAKQIWKRDEEKRISAEICGFDVFYIWESDLKNNTEITLQTCKNYLTQ